MKDNKTPDWLQNLQETDIRSVKSEDLIDIDSVTIRKDLPPGGLSFDHLFLMSRISLSGRASHASLPRLL